METKTAQIVQELGILLDGPADGGNGDADAMYDGGAGYGDRGHNDRLNGHAGWDAPGYAY